MPVRWGIFPETRKGFLTGGFIVVLSVSVSSELRGKTQISRRAATIMAGTWLGGIFFGMAFFSGTARCDQ
jgi:hypothetical protein